MFQSFPRNEKTLLEILECYPNVHELIQIDFVMILLQCAVAWKSKYILSFETSSMTPIWVAREVLAEIPLPTHEPKYSRLQGKPRSFKRKMGKNHVVHGYSTTIMLKILTFCIVILGWSLQVMFTGSMAEVEGHCLISHVGGKCTLNWSVSFPFLEALVLLLLICKITSNIRNGRQLPKYQENDVINFLRTSAYALKLAFGETNYIIIFIWSMDFTYRKVSQTPSFTRRLCAFITWKFASKLPAQFFKDSFDSKNVFSRSTKVHE